jgi:hypothetical protein
MGRARAWGCRRFFGTPSRAVTVIRRGGGSYERVWYSNPAKVDVSREDFCDRVPVRIAARLTDRAHILGANLTYAVFILTQSFDSYNDQNGSNKCLSPKAQKRIRESFTSQK